MKLSNRDAAFWIALTAIVALAAWLRLHALGLSQLWLDEIWTAIEVDQGPLAIVKFTLRVAGLMPISYLLPWIAVHFGPYDFMLRFPDAMFGLLTVPLAASTAWRLGRSRTAALAAAAILAVSDHHLWYSREARGYAVTSFFALLSFRLLIEALETGGLRWWIGLFISGVLGHYTSYFYCFTLPSLAVWGYGWLAIAARRGELPRKEIVRLALLLAASLFGAAAVFMPWAIAASNTYSRYSATGPVFDTSGLIGRWLGSVLLAWLPAAPGWRVAAAVLIAAGDFTMLPSRRGLLVLTLATPLAAASLLFMISTSGHFLVPRYMIAALPAVAVGAGLGAAGIAELGRRLARTEGGSLARRMLEPVAAGAALTLLGLNCFAQLRSYETWATMQKQDWKSAMAILLNNARRNDLIIPGLEDTSVCLDYYLPEELKPNVAPADWGTAEHMVKNIGAMRAKNQRVWYVVPDFVIKENADMRHWFDANFRLYALIPGSQTSICIYLGPKPAAGGQ